VNDYSGSKGKKGRKKRKIGRRKMAATESELILKAKNARK
jgi:hypothetical protein